MSISSWPQRILGKILGIFCSGRNLIFTPLWIIIGQLRIGAIGAVVVVFGALVLLVANNGARSRLTYSQNTIVKPLLQTI